MEETNLESLFRQPFMLIEDIKFAANEVDSYIQECLELRSHLETLNSCLHKAVHMVREGNPRFCVSPTQRIVDEASRTLETCCFLLRKCRKGGLLKRLLTITSAMEFKKAKASVEDSIANVNWLLNSVTDEELGSVIGMPPISSTSPNLSVIWSLLSKLQGGTPELREAAASDLASMAAASEQNGQFIIQEGGVPQLLKVLHDGTLEGKVMAATALGNLAISQERVRQMVHQGLIPACVRVLEQGMVQVKAKITWALTEMILRDPEIQIELGNANAVKQFVALMFETDENLSVVASTKVAALQVLVNASLPAEKGVTISETIPSHSSGVCNHKTLRTSDESEWLLSDNSTHSRSASEILYHGSTSSDVCNKEREKSSEFKQNLKVQVTRALWLLAANNIKNSRRITETRAMLGFAKLIEMEQGEVKRNAIMAVMELAAAAEIDTDFRKFAFKPTSPAAKATVNQLHRLILDDSVDPDLQVCCIKAVGSLARTFSAKDNKVIKALVSKLSYSDRRRLPVTAEALNTLLKFTGEDNFLCQDHSLAILEFPGLPFLVQLVALDVEKSVQVLAILLLSQLALHVGSTKNEAFQEAAALSVLKSVATSASTLEQFAQVPIRDHILQAIYHLEFCQAGRNNMHSSRV